MNPLGNIEKWVVGSVLGLISLLVIYGASASNRVASWLDGPASGRSDLVGLNANGTSNSTNNRTSREARSAGQGTSQIIAQSDSAVDPDDMTPIEKAGQLPQRQTVVEQPARSEDIRVQPLETAPTDAADTATSDTAATPANTTNTTNNTNTAQADPTPTVTQPTQETTPQPVRALW